MCLVISSPYYCVVCMPCLNQPQLAWCCVSCYRLLWICWCACASPLDRCSCVLPRQLRLAWCSCPASGSSASLMNVFLVSGSRLAWCLSCYRQPRLPLLGTRTSVWRCCCAPCVSSAWDRWRRRSRPYTKLLGCQYSTSLVYFLIKLLITWHMFTVVPHVKFPYTCGVTCRT